MDSITIGDGELVTSDWQRTLKIRKPIPTQPGQGVYALVPERDCDDLQYLVGYDWCGNPIEYTDASDYRIGQVFNIDGLGMLATPTLIDISYEMDRAGVWDYVLTFHYPAF